MEYRCTLDGRYEGAEWSDWSDIDHITDTLARRGKGMVDTRWDRRYFRDELSRLNAGSRKWIRSLGAFEYGTSAGRSVVEGWIECRA